MLVKLEAVVAAAEFKFKFTAENLKQQFKKLLASYKFKLSKTHTLQMSRVDPDEPAWVCDGQWEYNFCKH